ncbi:regulatory protein [Alkalihalobacillus xiaoxiensis]|uniref:Regulatory protein RecX n=1 Tax=Shouchella xiaoxiensis TaxID=766895 RepID=A0ABS2T0U6_9BACI|nr:recombination regulator RecX [Shouchella xiaoxiensis]MBM7841379.1 regulatory protein [Shouchella xiaoxiensis]
MIRISKITVQKKMKQRYNVYVDEKGTDRYSFSVDEDTLIKFGMRKGLELNEDEIKEIVDADEAKKTQHLAIHYLSFRMRSEKEMIDYLEKKERQPEHIKQAITFLKRERLVDDFAFAGAFIRTKINQSHIGPSKLKQQLKQKGVLDQIIDESLLPYDLDWQKIEVKRWLEKLERRKVESKESQQQQRNKQINQLLSKGFDYEAIVSVLNNHVEEDADQEIKALQFQAEKMVRTYSKKYSGYELKQRLTQALARKGFSFSDITSVVDELLQGDDI